MTTGNAPRFPPLVNISLAEPKAVRRSIEPAKHGKINH